MHDGEANADYIVTDLDSGSVLSVCGEHFLPCLVGLVMAQCDARGTTPAEVFGWLEAPPDEPEQTKAEQTPKRRASKPTDQPKEGEPIDTANASPISAVDG